MYLADFSFLCNPAKPRCSAVKVRSPCILHQPWLLAENGQLLELKGNSRSWWMTFERLCIQRSLLIQEAPTWYNWPMYRQQRILLDAVTGLMKCYRMLQRGLFWIYLINCWAELYTKVIILGFIHSEYGLFDNSVFRSLCLLYLKQCLTKHIFKVNKIMRESFADFWVLSVSKNFGWNRL